MDQTSKKPKTSQLKTTVSDDIKLHFQYVVQKEFEGQTDSSVLRKIIIDFLKTKPKPPPEDQPSLFA